MVINQLYLPGRLIQQNKYVTKKTAINLVIYFFQVTVQQNSCKGLPQSCPAGPETETRTSMCTCQSVSCTWGNWSDWSGKCGLVNRTRHIVEAQTTVQAENCDGVKKKCTQQPETENNKLPDCKRE